MKEKCLPSSLIFYLIKEIVYLKEPRSLQKKIRKFVKSRETYRLILFLNSNTGGVSTVFCIIKASFSPLLLQKQYCIELLVKKNYWRRRMSSRKCFFSILFSPTRFMNGNLYPRQNKCSALIRREIKTKLVPVANLAALQSFKECRQNKNSEIILMQTRKALTRCH